MLKKAHNTCTIISFFPRLLLAIDGKLVILVWFRLERLFFCSLVINDS